MALALAPALAPGLGAASPQPPVIHLGETAGPVEILRCHFDEGRMVVRHGDTHHVLRAGDAIGGAGLTVLEITSESATLAIRQNPLLGSLRLIRITGAANGALDFREFATNPDELTTGPTAPRNKVPLNVLATVQPTSQLNGD